MKRLNILFIIALLALILAACGSEEGSDSDGDSDGNASGDSNEFDLVKDGKLTFAASGEFKPFSYMEDGKMVGYDVAVGETIAEELGLEAVQEKAKFAGIVAGVKAGRYDIAVASHTINEDRLKEVNFSEPYYYSGPVIFTRPDSDIKAAEDLEGKEISVSRGSTYVEMAQEYTDNIPQVDSDVVALQSLAKGHHDAVITDAITGQTAIDSGLEIENRGQLGVSEQAVAIAKDNEKLQKAVDEALKELKESGKLKELAMEWVGVDITKEPEELN